MPAARPRAVIINNDDPDSDYGARHLAAAFHGPFETVVLSPLGGFGPPDEWLRAHAVGALILSGSDRSVTQALPWMLEEEVLLRRCIDVGMPVLAICFAHQLLGRALGAGIVTGMKRTGLLRVETVGGDPAFAGLPATIVVPEQHSDQLSRVPQGFRLIATSDYCAIQAIRHWSAPVYGVQFHPCYEEDVLDHDDAWAGLGLRGRFHHHGAAILRNVARLFADRPGT